jgi:hypothetical protein
MFQKILWNFMRKGNMKRTASAIFFAVMLAFASVSYGGEMPADIFAKVKASIESRYPDNYSMQKTLIANQVQSYKFLQSYSPSIVPSDVFENIKGAIESRYPYNFSMQKTLIQDQVQSYEYLKTYAPSSVPQNVLDRIKNKISSRYPYNFSMQKTLIEDQVRSYLDLNK